MRVMIGRNETSFEYKGHKITVIDSEKAEKRFEMQITGPLFNISVSSNSLTHLVDTIKENLEGEK